MIKEKQRPQFGELGLVPKCITLHNSCNYKLGAREIYNEIQNGKDHIAMHYIIDHNEIIEVMPLDWKVHQTEKGNDYAYNNSIAIEVCSNLNNNLYLQGQNKAIELIKVLMKKYSISKTDIYFHNDWNNKVYCPCNILDRYGSKKKFIEKFFKEDK